MIYEQKFNTNFVTNWRVWKNFLKLAFMKVSLAYSELWFAVTNRWDYCQSFMVAILWTITENLILFLESYKHITIVVITLYLHLQYSSAHVAMPLLTCKFLTSPFKLLCGTCISDLREWLLQETLITSPDRALYHTNDLLILLSHDLNRWIWLDDLFLQLRKRLSLYEIQSTFSKIRMRTFLSNS